MEVGLGVVLIGQKIRPFLSLNPCFNGSRSRSPKYNDGPFK